MSVRTLSQDLGVSHGLLHQRFGTKPELWRAAVDHAFSHLAQELAVAFDPTVTDPLVQLNLTIRQFLRFAAKNPDVLALMNLEAQVESDRIDYVHERYIAPALAPLARLLDHLVATQRVRPVSLATLHFLIACGGAAPFTLTALTRRLDGHDLIDPADIERHIQTAADILTAGLMTP